MQARHPHPPLQLPQGATVAVVGGGPAGAFFAIHLLRLAQRLGRTVRPVIFEPRWQAAPDSTGVAAPCWKGCNSCAGGISPRLNERLRELGLSLPEEIIQSRIHSVTVQGYWKNIELDAPAGREMLAVYRGSNPARREDRQRNFDSFLLQAAARAGAQVIGAEAETVEVSPAGKPQVFYQSQREAKKLEADFVVFAAGVNGRCGRSAAGGSAQDCLKRLLPKFRPPRVRQAMIFELETPARILTHLAGKVFFVEYGSKELRLEMCSLVPKKSHLTVVLVGKSVTDFHWRQQLGKGQAAAAGAGRHPAAGGLAAAPGRRVADAERAIDLARQFLDLPHIRKLIPRQARLRAGCLCAANLVIGAARQPFGDRAAAVGDLAAARLYKDGIFSAYETAQALADTVMRLGLDEESLRRGYSPVLRRIQRDNRYAAAVFLLHRIFFTSSVLSRVLYQAVITERKNRPAARRPLEKILWRIASGDDDYSAIFFSLIHPATLVQVLTGGLLLTLRNAFAEAILGLRWEGFGRFTTGVAKERLEEKSAFFAKLIADSRIAIASPLEFERMYTIKIWARRADILHELGKFGEPDREFLRPRGVRIFRTSGEPNQPGCVIRYEIGPRWFSFQVRLEQLLHGHVAVYRVLDGFARGGVLIFEIEQLAEEISNLSIYVGFNFTRGKSWRTRPLWRLFRALFPSFIHDVIWNHSLCQFKDLVEMKADQACG